MEEGKIAEIIKVLEQYGLVDSPEINSKLIERAAKIINREFKVERINPLDLDGGPIKLSGSSTPTPVASGETEHKDHYQKVIKEIKARQSAEAKHGSHARVLAREADEVEIEEEGEESIIDPSDVDLDELSAVLTNEAKASTNPKDMLEIERARPRRYNDERTVRGGNKSISRIE